MVKSSGQNDQYPFGWRVFSAWDFLITERETADNKLASLTTGIKVGTVHAQSNYSGQSQRTQTMCPMCPVNQSKLEVLNNV